MKKSEKKHALRIAERNSRATDLRHYRGMSLGVLAGAGTIFFGLMYIYTGLFQIDKSKLPTNAKMLWQGIMLTIPPLGIHLFRCI